MTLSITSIPGVSSFVDVRSSLEKHPTLTYSTRALTSITHIAVHHSATASGTVQSFAKYHVNTHGWPGIGYHFGIDPDGTVNWTNDLETISYHVGDNNSYCVGIEMTGNFEETAPTQAQWTSLYAVIRYLMGILKIPADNIKGHRELPGESDTLCPGKNVDMASVRTQAASGGTGAGVSTTTKISGQTYTGDWLATAYNPELGGMNSDGDNSTASSTTFTVGRTIAVDRGVIELGSVVHIIVPDHPEWSGIYLAEDVGGKIDGKHIDMGIKADECLIFGKRTVELAILEVGTGAQDARDKAANWDAIKAKYAMSSGGAGGSGGTGVAIDFEKNDPNSTMFRGKAPEVENDDYPAHRYAGNPYVLRIGDAQFYLPPNHIKTSKVTMVDSRHVIRAKNPQLTKSGYTTHKLEIRMYFSGKDMINGWGISGPGGLIYYMDGLRSLLAQFYKNPFLPIRHELINNRHGIFNVALQNISYSTVPDFPSLIVADLTFLECTVQPLVSFPDYMYDRLFIYPLFRWWYQNQLLDSPDLRFSDTYLKPVTEFLHGKVFFKALDRDLIEQMKDDVVAKNNSTVAGEYALSRMHIGDIKQLMTDWPLGDPILTSVTVGISKNLTPFHIDDFEKPVFQDLGGTEKEFVLEFYCTDRSQLESLQLLVSHLEEMTRDYRMRFVSGFLAIDNELVNLAGIYHAMVMGIDTENVDGFDNNYIVRLYCKSFDPTQKNQDRLNGFNYKMTEAASHFDEIEELDTKLDRKTSIAYEYMMNKAFNSLELYPDLELPTFEVANEWVTKINEYRVSRGQSKLPFDKLNQPPNAVWCDPDFYFAYPTAEQAYSAVEYGDMGHKILNVLQNGTYDEIENMTEEEMGFKEIYNQFVMGVQDNSWGTDVEWKEKKSRVSVNLDNAVKTFTTPAGQAWTDDNPIPSDSDLVNMMSRDMVRHNKRHRMSRAFPTYLLVFIDEGQWVDGKRLFNNYYTYHAIHQLDVVKDKNNPVDLAYIRLSNVYGTFDWESSMTDPRTYATEPKGLWNRIKALYTDFNFTVTDKVMRESSELMEHAKLVEGARVHIRLGYSATADDMPIVFNGHIASAGEGEDIDIVCQGDGVELINNLVSTDPKGHTPNEPHNAIREIMTKRTSNYWFAVSADYEFAENYLSEYGIEHFGFVESTASSGFWKGLIEDHWKILWDEVPFNDYDVMKNIYKGSQSPVTGAGTKWNPFDGEKNINISSYNKTPWDIGQTLSQFVPEFIFAAHEHGFRSTLFFGMPHWPVKYGYELIDGQEGTSYAHYNEKVKPFQQFHTITTGNDIIYNGIKASSEHIKHVAVGIYKLGDGQNAAESWTVYADRSIARDKQKTMIVDTGVWQDLFGPDFLYTVLGKYVMKPLMELPADLASVLGDIVDWVPGDFADKLSTKLQESAQWWTDLIDEDAIFTPGQVQARTVAIGALQRSFMEMYQGEIVTFGDPALKPWDIFYLNDTHLLMEGTAQVGRVSHSLSRATGFTSVIKPDLVVSRTDGKGSRLAIINGLIAVGSAVTVYMTRKMVTSRFAVWIVERSGRATVKAGKGAAKLTGKVVPKTLKGGRIAKWGSKIVDTGADALKSMKLGSRGLKLLKSNLFTTVLAGALSEYLQTMTEKETKYNNMIYIYPLWKMGRPFAAGITGAAHIIPGYIDDRWYDPLRSGTAKKTSGGSGSSSNTSSTGTIMHPLGAPTRITDTFGSRGGAHYGTDIATKGVNADGSKMDTSIYAVADGEIIRSGFEATMGNFVFLKINVDGQDHTIIYMHMQEKDYLWNGLTTGSTVKMGTFLGYIGNTGDSYGAHLHIEVCIGSNRVKGTNDNRTDPEVWFKKYGVTL